MRISIAVLIAAGALSWPAVAGATDASVVSHDPLTHQTVFKVGAAPGDVDIDERWTPEMSFTFTDARNPLVAKGACVQGMPVLCPWAPMAIKLGPLADRLRVWTSFIPATVTGGAGDDVMTDSARFGTLRAGPGDDVVRANGKQLDIYGDGNDDRLYAREQAVRLYGGDGNDLMVSDAGPGATMEGGDGYDVLIRGSSVDAGGTMSGGADDDVIGFEPTSDAYAGTIAGGAGYDSVHGSNYADAISGGPGNDEIWTYDGGVDDVNCGGGWDEIYADAADVVAANCERVTLGPGPSDPRLESALARAADLRAQGGL